METWGTLCKEKSQRESPRSSHYKNRRDREKLQRPHERTTNRKYRRNQKREETGVVPGTNATVSATTAPATQTTAAVTQTTSPVTVTTAPVRKQPFSMKSVIINILLIKYYF